MKCSVVSLYINGPNSSQESKTIAQVDYQLGQTRKRPGSKALAQGKLEVKILITRQFTFSK